MLVEIYMYFGGICMTIDIYLKPRWFLFSLKIGKVQTEPIYENIIKQKTKQKRTKIKINNITEIGIFLIHLVRVFNPPPPPNFEKLSSKTNYV